jgi:hypothetical protein
MSVDRRTEILLAYGRMFETVDGKTVLQDLEASFLYRAQINLHSAAPVDPYKMACMEGERQVVLRIREMIQSAEHLTPVAPVRLPESYLAQSTEDEEETLREDE